ncbi:MAG: hypothetical protein ABI783_04060 [Actinomycetota bacterium]
MGPLDQYRGKGSVVGGTLDHIGLVAFAGLGVWTLIVSVLLVARADAA